MDYLMIAIVFSLGLLAVAALAIASVISDYLKTRKAQEEYVFLQRGAETIVRYVEQAAVWDSSQSGGPAKKERALLQFGQWAVKRGFDLTFEELNLFLEEAVSVAFGASLAIEGEELVMPFLPFDGQDVPEYGNVT